MRARRLLLASLVLALAVPVLAGDGDKPPAPPEPKKPAEAKAPAPEKKDAKDAKDAAAKAKEQKEKAALAALAARPAPRDLDDAMRRLARIRVNVNFKETSFTEAIEYVRR